jgi:hypothetical protein
MDSNDNDKEETTPIPDSSKDVQKSDIDDYNPYRDDNEGEEKEEKEKKEEKKDKKENEYKESIFDIDPEKGNISEQLGELGTEFDYPTQTKIISNQDNQFNDAKNMQMNNEVPQALDDDFNPYGKDNNTEGNKNEENETRNFLDNFKEAINNNTQNMNNNLNNNINNNNQNYNNNFNNNNYNNNFNNNNFNNNNNYGNNYNNNNYNINYNNNYNNNNNFNNNNYNNNFNNNNYNNNNFNNNNYNNNNFNNNNNNINNNNNYNNNNNNSNDENIKKIQKILDTCTTRYKNALVDFKNYKIPESKSCLEKLITSLDTLTKTINEKNQNASSLLPNISSLRAEVSRKLSEYNFMTYQLILNLFKNIKYDPKMDLATFTKKFFLSCPFISFNDIYDPSTDPNQGLQKNILEIYNRSQRTGIRGILLYGPRGSGKTLVVHALAKQLGAVVAQLEGVQNLKIKYFVTEFGRLCSEYINRPVIIFVKNIDLLAYNNALPELMFLYDKFNNNSKKNITFIVSSTSPPQYLPKQLKFTYIQCVNCANQSMKYGLFKFLIEKLGITISMMEQDLSNFVYQNMRNYSNKDVFLVIKCCLDLKKQAGGNLQEIDRSILERALRNIKGSLNQQFIQGYNL